MPDQDRLRGQLESDRAIDRLAAVEHERWAHWQQYAHSKCERRDDGSLVIPPQLVAHWERQIHTAYVDLTPEEQDSDRDQVRRYLPTVIDILGE